ncbi:pyridoxal phosphate-dependent transferase [Apodospora peruviana]|uniref:Pyridoxal phosphate-dependent transferase n=1 Tax=Apodospora peruviana TaxID=516989 RepID=A0AAE0M460_9PEZI|nr:pyridoxal phosphate-dependent transferase [Apodospora peruviana]
MDSKDFREAAISSIDEIINYFDNLGDRDVVSTVEPGYLRKLLPSEAPDDGEPWTNIQRDIEAKIMPGITHWQHPGFHAFFPCATSYPSILGELYSAALSGACFNWICSPAVTELETIVLDWLAKLLGLPECFLSTGPTRGGGVIQGSASEAVLTAMVAARDKYLIETIDSNLEGEAREDVVAHKRSRMVALATNMTHSSTKKAAIILGVRFKTIAVNAADNYALTESVLATTLADCRALGLEPFFLTATLGTTDTCAVDDFAGIASALDSYNKEEGPGGGEIWVHVDAAYAGAALVCPEVQAATNISLINRFHSFDMNMHKWLLTNFDASCLFVRNRNWFVQALSVNQAVYGNSASDGGLVTDYREWQIPLGRRFRSLKIWFVLRSYGRDGLREYIRRTTKLGEEFAGWMRERKDLFEVLTGPSFALTVFRMAASPKEADKEEGEPAVEDQRNAMTKKLCDEVNRSGRMWVTSTILDGRFAIRFMTGVRRTEKEHVEAAFRLLVEAAEEIMNE